MRRSALILVALVALVAGLAAVGSLAAFTSRADNSGSSVTAVPDLTEPAISPVAIGKTQGGSAGFVKASGTYRVYANVTESGNPASGIQGVGSNTELITTGASTAELSAGSFTVDGQSYNYATAPLTADKVVGSGSATYSIGAVDKAGNAKTVSGMSVILDSAAPSATDVQTTNVSGGTNGRPELGDVLTLTFSEPIDPVSILSGWTGSATNVVVRIADGGSGNDTLTVYNAANTTLTALGSINLGGTGYVTAATTFGASGTASKMVLSGSAVTVTLGTAAGTVSTSSATTTLRWTPSASAFDRAANAMSTTARNETGTADKDF